MAKFNPLPVFKAVSTLGLPTVLDVVRYDLKTRLRREHRRKPAAGRFSSLGRVATVLSESRGVRIQAQRGQLEIRWLTSEIVRVRLGAGGQAPLPPPFSYAILPSDWPAVHIAVDDTLAALTLRSDHLVVQIDKETSRLRFETPDGRVISEDVEGIEKREHEVRWTRHLPENEACYGLGERAFALNLRGRSLVLWNSDPAVYERGDDPLYLSIPFYLGVRPGLAFGLLWDNPVRGYVDLDASQTGTMRFGAEDDSLCIYFFAGPDVPGVLRQYTWLTGRMPLPPLWALGFHQSRWSYLDEAEFRTLAREFRERRLPCDVLHFDIDYMDNYRCFTWNRQRFPLLPTLLGELRKQGFRAVAIIDPGIKVDPGYPVYDEGVEQDVFLKYPDGKRVSAPVWPGNSHFPDFSSARVRAWWGAQYTPLIQAGFAGFWNDMNEPTVLGLKGSRTLPDSVVHDWDGLGQSHDQGGHNLYGLLMARATRQGLSKLQPDKRPFVMTRAGYAGAQRYTYSWTGDNVSSWDHLRLSISMALNMGLSGLPFTGPDVGGFAGEPDSELFVRWMQLGCMLPFFRSHAMKGTPPQEPWAFGEPYESASRAALELRYQMLPSLYSACAQCAQDGMPIVRPLFMLEPDDPDLYDRDDSFLLGDSILVAPVLEAGAVEREVYLPRGIWYEFDTNKMLTGGRSVTVDAPLERLPLFIRGGAVLPLWPVMQFVGEKPIQELRLGVYAGNGDTTLYEDAGEGLSYEQGDYRWSYFACRFLPTGQFAIVWRRAGNYRPTYQQVRAEIVGISSEPDTITLDGQGAPVWYYENGIVELVSGTFSDVRIGGESVESSQAARTLMRPPDH